MGKKKKYKDIFDVSPEEQKALMDAFSDLEKGEKSILDVVQYEVPTSPKRHVGNYVHQIEDALFGEDDVSEDESENYDESYPDRPLVTEYEKVIGIQNTEPNEVPKPPTETEDERVQRMAMKIAQDRINELAKTSKNSNDDSEASTVPRITFKYNNTVGRMIIDDGLISTAVSVMHTSMVKSDPEYFPDGDEAFGEFMSKIFFYIVACKHPSLIVDIKTFELEFNMFESLSKKFVFFKNETLGKVFCYVLEENATKNFYHVESEFKLDKIGLYLYAICTAYTVGTVHNIFQFEDEDEVMSVMNARNDVKSFIKLIESDPETKYSGHNYSSHDIYKSLRVINHEKFIMDVRTLLDDSLLDDEDDDEDYGDIDDMFDNINEEESETDETEVDVLGESNKSTIETVPPNKDDSFIMPTIRKGDIK